LTPQQFIAKWQRVTLSERSACQQHFLDLCHLLSQPKPAEADPEGAWYTLEKGVQTTEGGKGWADVWMRGHFGWEYKGKHKDLKSAYSQLLLYREALENLRLGPQGGRHGGACLLLCRPVGGASLLASQLACKSQLPQP